MKMRFGNSYFIKVTLWLLFNIETLLLLFRTYIEPQMGKFALHWMLGVGIAPKYSLGVHSEGAQLSWSSSEKCVIVP